MSMRVIAGRWRGRALKAPPGRATRPTLGRARESLFSILGPRLEGARVLDGYAGSGALGIEALSRGASAVIFMEQAPAALAALRANLLALGATGEETLVLPLDVRRAFASDEPPGGVAPLDLVLLDPPYGSGLAEEAVRRLGRARPAAWLGRGALVAAQVGRDDPMPEASGTLRLTRREFYGRTRVDFFEQVDQP